MMRVAIYPMGAVLLFALISLASLSLHIRAMKAEIDRQPFRLSGVTRHEAQQRLLEWRAQRKRLWPTAVLLIVAVGVAMHGF
ncbi:MULTISPECIES: hypothetical protein [unclassified Paraburkholderia]|uniref:hypothetical protein n=1 Tax=unclassified Paraburkholderia TaxID=2615204 RepID=UPI002AB0513E|nr:MULTISPECIES: hypothetical protein [unclassified Paraburkholderia]